MPLLASLFAIVIGGIIVAIIGFNPLVVYGSLVSGAFGNLYNLGSTLSGAVPLILIGLGIAIAFKAGLFNIGADGQYWVGAMASVWIGYHFTGMPGFPHILLALLGGMLAGGIWGGIVPGLAKAYLGAHEVITTMMMSYIGIFLVEYMIEEPHAPMRQPGFFPQSPQIATNTQLAPFLPLQVFQQSQLSVGLWIALAAAVVVWILLQRTTFGFQVRAVGFNQRASRYAGIRVPLYTVLTLGISGVFAGLAGGVQMLGVQYQLNDSFASQYGYTAIVVSLLARNNPFGCVIAGIFFAALNTGGQNMQQVSGVPASLTQVLTGLIIFFVAAERLIPMMRAWVRRRRPDARSHAADEGGTLA
ncbi:ABC transporter permease [Alicyclobacillus cycloheptanicus]|nr:ABC transporter permease [Alicyclobacillus cycloheptanicus]